MQIIRLPLEGTSNTRDIGGYVGSNNRVFKWGKVLRSDCVARLTDKDIDYLVNKYKLKKVIDLRSVSEKENAPNVFETDDRVDYVNISLADEIDPNKPLNLTELSDKFFSDFYVKLIQNKQGHIKNVITEISNIGEDESVLFHCTAGKDRTGVTTMLLLGICGVSKQDITTNYMQTATNLKYNKEYIENNKKMFEKYKTKVSDDLLKKLASSDEAYIEHVYDVLIHKFGSFKEYFLHIGITEEEIEGLINKLTVELE